MSSSDFSNKAFLQSAYTSDKIHYYNSPENKKKSKWKRNLAFAFTALTTLSLASITLARSGAFAKVKNSKAFNIANSLSSNFTNVKDDLWDRFAKWCKDKPVLNIVDKTGEKLTGGYRKIVHGACKGDYEKAYKNVVDNLNGEKLDILDFDTYFDEINNSIHKTVKENRVSKNLFFKKGFAKKVSSSNIADNYINGLGCVKKAHQELEVPQNASKELSEAIKNFNEVKLRTSEKMIPKLRDINAGSAPTDVISWLSTIGLLGGSLALSDNKEERKSTMLNLGIPLSVTVITAIVGVLKCFSGIKAMAIGLATGELASLTAKFIDRKLTKKQGEDF